VALTKVCLDFNISERVGGALNALYAQHGYDFVHLRHLVAHDSEDIFWADAYKQAGGRYVISGDCKIAYKPHEAIAFVENGLVSVFPSENWAGFKLREKAVPLIYYWPTIENCFKSAKTGTNWRLNIKGTSGHIALGQVDLTRLEIPDHVLLAAKARWLATRTFRR
jgi:hypothetical protein